MASATPVEQNQETTVPKETHDKDGNRLDDGMFNVNGLPQTRREPIVTKKTHNLTINGKRQSVTITRQKN